MCSVDPLKDFQISWYGLMMIVTG